MMWRYQAGEINTFAPIRTMPSSAVLSSIVFGHTSSNPPFPFFDLPAEIRNQIYSNIFLSKHPEHLITPDIDRCRQHCGMEQRLPDTKGRTALLRTCQQANEEATAVLYGDNTFLFDDEPYGKWRTRPHGFNFTIPRCDFLTMYAFLCRIGSRNRVKIQHLRLKFSYGTFTAYPHEFPFELNEVNSSIMGGAACVGDALEVMAKGHNLLTFEIELSEKKIHRDSCYGSDDDDSIPELINPEGRLVSYTLQQLFHADGALTARLRQFRGVKELKILTATGIDFTSMRHFVGVGDMPRWPFFMQVKREMETGDSQKEKDKMKRERLEKEGFRWPRGTRYGFDKEPVDQRKGEERLGRKEAQYQCLMAVAKTMVARAECLIDGT